MSVHRQPIDVALNDDDMPARVAAAFVWFAAHVMVRELGRGAREAALGAGRRCLEAGRPHEAARWDAIVEAIDRIAATPAAWMSRETPRPLISVLA